MKYLEEQEIREMRRLREGLVSSYGTRDEMMKRYEEIYFMSRGEKPKGLNVDESDIKETISSSGRDAVTGMKRILDTAKIHVNIKGQGGDLDKLEAGLKRMVEVSGDYRPAGVEKDMTLSAILYGPATLMVESVQDLIDSQYKTTKGTERARNDYVAAQLETIHRRTPFLMYAINARTSYPMWGAYGMIGHLRRYTLKGSEIQDRFGVAMSEPSKDFTVEDFFHYEKRLIEAEGMREPLLACEWVSRDEGGKIIGSINIPVFTRYAGGTSLFAEPDRMSQPLLYAKAKGNWDLRENLLWTYLFTALYNQGMPGPIIMVDPENADQEIVIDYQNGVRIIKAKGQLADPQVIDGDVLQIKNLMDGQAAVQTIHPQTLGENTKGVTFSQYALASKAGLIPAQDPKEAMEAVYKDAFTHILERIKKEGIENELIQPADIPETFELTVRLEPDLEQDDLRNAQVVQSLKAAGANVSDEWINTNLLKIADNKAMTRDKAKEDMFKALLGYIGQKPEILEQFVMGMLGLDQARPPQPNPDGGGGMEEGSHMMPDGTMMPGSEHPTPPAGAPAAPGRPQTDAMIPPYERQ